MADFILEYDILESIANNSKSLGKRSKEYSEKLESKIITGIDRVAGPSSGYLTSASDSVRDKINALKLKSDAFYHFADQITNLLEVAEQIDQEVADAIAAQREYFLDHHEALRIDDWKAKLLGLIVDIKNSIPLLDTIADILDGLNAVFEALEDSIKHWYECEGGKYIVRAVGSVVVAAVSVALFVAAFPVSGFFAVCGAIGAGIAAINGITNVATSFRAADAAIDGDPAWAVIYGKQDKLSDVLRQTNFGSGGWNALSNLGAGALDTTETICDVVGFAEIGKNAIKLFKGDAFKFLKNKGSMDFSDLKNGSKSDIVDLKNNILDGYADSKNGIKEITPPKSSLGDMSVDDLTRYNKHWDDLATGAHDIPYGMNAEEYYQHLKGPDKVNDSVKGGSYLSFRDGMTPEEIARYDDYWKESITSIPKGSRPDPSTYLSQDYIDTHLAQFDNGVSVIQTDWAYSRYSETNGFVGVPDDNTLFVMPKNYCDNVISSANGSISVVEKELGFPDGYFSDGGGLVRIDVDTITELNIRIPSGNEAGANKLWIPGGVTSGGVPEAITDIIPLENATVTRLEIN